MRRTIALPLAVPVLVVAVLPAQSGNADEQAIRKQIQRLDSRERGIYTQDAIFWSGAYVRPLLGAQDKGEEVRGELQLSNRVPGSQVTRTAPVRIEIATGGDMAYEFSNNEFSYKLKTGGTVTSRASALRVWKKVSGEWKVAASFSRPHWDQPGVSNRTGAQTTPSALDRFVGNWQEDEARLQLGYAAPLVFRRSATGTLEELRGGLVNPQVQQVVFDGQRRVVDANGRAIAWSQLDERTFRRISFDKEGRVFMTRTLRISPGGKTLTDEVSRPLPEGGMRTEFLGYRRTAGDSGLLGTWAMQSFKSDNPLVTRIERSGDGLTMTRTDGGGQTQHLTLTGQPVAVSGAGVITGGMAASTLVDSNTIEVTASRDGDVMSRTRYVLSPDGRTITVTVTGLGANASPQPTVAVLVKK